MLVNVGQILSERARLSAEMTGLVDLVSGDRLTFEALNGRSNRVVHGLIALGVKPGDRVGVLMSNRHEYVEVFYGLAKLGAITVFLNWRLTPSELEYIADDSSASTVLYSDDLSALVAGLKPIAPTVQRWIGLGATDDISYSDMLSEDIAEPDLGAQGDDPLFIMYTSGTTGKPKGAVISHAGSLGWHTSMAATSDVRYGEKFYCVAPLFHIGGIGFIMSCIYLGLTSILDQVFDPDRVWQIIEREKVDVAFLVPAMLNFLAKSPLADTTDFATLRAILCGAAPVPVSLIKHFGAKGVEIHQIYGATETHGGICLMAPEYALSKAGSTGKGYFGMDVRVVDDAGRDVAPGEPGEVITRGAHVLKEYWNKPEETAKAFKDGWFYLGDIAEVDQDGFIYIKDRSKDMIISGGENIYPAEIEDLILSHANVKEVAVIGQPSEKWGESPTAIVVPTEGADTAALEAILDDMVKQKLARFKRPKAYAFIDEIPRNPSGKALKRVLRDQFPGPAPE